MFIIKHRCLFSIRSQLQDLPFATQIEVSTQEECPHKTYIPNTLLKSSVPLCTLPSKQAFSYSTFSQENHNVVPKLKKSNGRPLMAIASPTIQYTRLRFKKLYMGDLCTSISILFFTLILFFIYNMSLNRVLKFRSVQYSEQLPLSQVMAGL